MLIERYQFKKLKNLWFYSLPYNPYFAIELINQLKLNYSLQSENKRIKIDQNSDDIDCIIGASLDKWDKITIANITGLKKSCEIVESNIPIVKLCL